MPVRLSFLVAGCNEVRVLARPTHRPSWIHIRSLGSLRCSSLQAQNATGATIDSTGLTAMIVIAPRRMNLQVTSRTPIFERYRMPGVETRLPVIFSEFVGRRGMSVERFVELTAAAPARLNGLTQKGATAVGADADVVVWDRERTRVLDVAEMHMGMDYEPYADGHRLARDRRRGRPDRPAGRAVHRPGGDRRAAGRRSRVRTRVGRRPLAGKGRCRPAPGR